MYLNCHSVFSLRYGTIPIKELLELAQRHQVSPVLTDINNTSACLEYIRLAPTYNVVPKVGIDFRNDAEQLFVGLARNNDGFYELNTYLSKYLHDKEDIPVKAPHFPNAIVIYPFAKYPNFFELATNEYLGIRPEHLNHLALSPWKNYQNKMVIMQSVSFRDKPDFNTHRLLRAIANNTLLSKLAPTDQASEKDVLIPPKELEELFKLYPKIITTTKRVADACSIEFDFNTAKNKKYYTSDVDADRKLMQHLSQEGLRYRYGETPSEEIFIRLEKELTLINKMGFNAYFLINWDILKYARKQGYFYVGRGSGANSIVAYCLRITDVDPIELDLYFERFINQYRKNPPDFDIDFSWKDREDITTYIFKKHGWQYTALLATYNTFQRRAVIRELGKVLGLPKSEIDRLSDKDAPPQDSMGKLVMRYSKRIHGMPNYLSVHAGGIIISEKPIHCYTATSLPPKGYPLTHFSMLESEDIGLNKYDILSQRGLGHIKDAVHFVEQNNEVKLDIHNIQQFKKDKKIHELLKNGRTMGCFYVESPAMRMLLKKLKAYEYKHLVAASSIIRPGVAKSGMMREYILRFHDRKRMYATPKQMLELLKETFGVMVYQEDVIKVAHYFAGLTLGESDVLRRGMSGKFRSREEFQKVKDKFFENCTEIGHQPAVVKEIWRQIESFAGYSFSKGHSASYAVESYQSLYLKAHYPLEFMVGVINNFGGFYRTEIYVNEAKKDGAHIEAQCVNTSEYFTSIRGKTVHLGFVHLKSFERNSAELILNARVHGKFDSLSVFMKRVPLAIEQLRILIRIGAFRFTRKTKKELLWEMHWLYEGKDRFRKNLQLFDAPKQGYDLPALDYLTYEDAYDEMELLGFPLSSPFLLIKDMPKQSTVRARQLPSMIGKTIHILGYLVATKRVHTSNKKMMYFGNFLDEEDNFVDTTHFPPVAERFPFRGKGCYLLTGKVVSEFGHVSLEIVRMEFLTLKTLDNADPKDLIRKAGKPRILSIGEEGSQGWEKIG